MKLTGNCRQDFDTWYCNNDFDFHLVDFNELPNSMKWGIYLDFFDSVGITIEVSLFSENNWQNQINETDDWFIDFETRNDAQKSAIKKANQYYILTH